MQASSIHPTWEALVHARGYPAECDRSDSLLLEQLPWSSLGRTPTPIESTWRMRKAAGTRQHRPDKPHTHGYGRRRCAWGPAACPRDGSCVPTGHDDGSSRSAVTGKASRVLECRVNEDGIFDAHHHQPSHPSEAPNSAPRMQPAPRTLPDLALSSPVAKATTRCKSDREHTLKYRLPRQR